MYQLKKLNKILTFLEGVSELSRERVESLCNKHVEDIKKEAISDELENRIFYAEEPMDELESLLGTQVGNLVISDDEILERMRMQVRANIYLEIEEEMKAIRERYTVPTGIVIDIRIKGNVLCGIFTSKVGEHSYQNERLDRVVRWKRKMEWKINLRKERYPFIIKSAEALEIQRKAVKNIASRMKESSMSVLMNYTFLDTSIKDGISKIYFSLTSEKCNPLYRGEDISRFIKWL